MIVDVALRWHHQTPRKASLDQLITWGETDRAEALAADDPDATIRARAEKSPPDASLFD